MSLREVVEKFVVFERSSPRAPAGEIPAQAPPAASITPPKSPPPAASSPAVAPPAPPVRAPGEPQGVDGEFAAIYRQAAISPVPFTAEQALETLSALPVELPHETKRQALKGVLQAMSKTLGTTPEAVSEDAVRKVGALTASIEGIAKQVNDFIAATDGEIATLQEQILERRKAIEDARRRGQELTQKFRNEADRLSVVLQFLGADAGPKKTT